MSEADKRKAGHAAKKADLAFIFHATTNKSTLLAIGVILTLYLPAASRWLPNR